MPTRGNTVAGIDTSGIGPGFADPVRDAQRVFRAVLDATAHPGRVVDLAPVPEPPAPLTPAAGALCLALADFETPLWLDSACAGPVTDHLRFHCGSAVVERPEAARFAVIAAAAARPSLEVFDPGSDAYPDTSATVLIQVADLRAGGGLRLTGPGIDGETRLTVNGAPERLWPDLARNWALFPCGVDIMLCTGTRLAALPRTTHVEA